MADAETVDEEYAGERRALLSSTKELSTTDSIRRLWHTDWCPWIPARYVLAVMSFLGFVNVYALRVNLSMALVVMVNNTQNAYLSNVSKMRTTYCAFLSQK